MTKMARQQLEVIAALAEVISRRAQEPSDSYYTSRLLQSGVQACAQKVGEEAVELALAAVAGDKNEISAEAGDLIYHLLVLLEAANVPLSDVTAVLEKRFGVGGLVEKANR